MRIGSDLQNETQSAGLYIDNQQKVIAYAKSHHSHMADCFAGLQNKMQNQGQVIKVDRVFDYLSEAFMMDGFMFKDGINGPNLLIQEKREKIEALLQKFYIQFKKIPRDKFLFYRLTITEDEIADLIQFWIKTDDRLYIEYDGTEQEQKARGTWKDPKDQLAKEQGNRQNEFIGAEDAIGKMIKQLLDELKQKQLELQKTTNELERVQIEAAINRLKSKVSEIENSRTKPDNEAKVSEAATSEVGHLQSHTSNNPQLRKINIKILFDYYCKQNHITGIKATFDRIEQESTSINYPKLIHFIKDFQVMDEKQPKIDIFHIFQKTAANYKSLQLAEFESLLHHLAHTLNPDTKLTDNEKQDIFFNKLFSHGNSIVNFKKKPKHLGTGKAFNIRESNGFRIKPEEIKYEFHLMAHSGKTADEIQDELVKRRQVKERYKQDLIRKKQSENQKFLKKLSSIDPFNSSLVHLKETTKEEHVAGIDNLESFRDSSFNPMEYFKISQDNEDDSLLSQYPIAHEKKKHRNGSRQPTENSPTRKDRAKSIVEEVSARAAELHKMQKSKNDNLIRNLERGQKKALAAVVVGDVPHGRNSKLRQY